MAQINWNGFLPQETGKALGAAGVCFVALVGAGWALFSFGYSRGKDIGQDELSAYKATSEAKLPEVTSGFLAVNKELRESLKVFERNKTLETENGSYQTQLAEAATARAGLDVAMKKLQDDLRAAGERESRLRDEIGKLAGESRHFTLHSNQAELLGEGHSVGLADSKSTTSLEITQDNKTYEMRAGSSISVDLNNKQCTITMVSLHWDPPVSA